MCVEHVPGTVNVVLDAPSCRPDLAVIVVEWDESDGLV